MSTHSDDTRHDDGDNTLHHEVGTKDGHGRNTNTGFSSAITSEERDREPCQRGRRRIEKGGSPNCNGEKTHLAPKPFLHQQRTTSKPTNPIKA